MLIVTFILQLVAIIAVIIFIVYTVTVHRRINRYINNLEDNLKDYQVHLDVDIKFRNNINDAVNTCSKLITLCNNTNLEVISKLKNADRDRDNKYNAIVSRITELNNLVVKFTELNNLVVKLNKIKDEIKKEAKNSYKNCSTIECPSARTQRNSKLKTAKNKEV